VIGVAHQIEQTADTLDRPENTKPVLGTVLAIRRLQHETSNRSLAEYSEKLDGDGVRAVILDAPSFEHAIEHQSGRLPTLDLGGWLDGFCLHAP
jgi:hypothetical protein